METNDYEPTVEAATKLTGAYDTPVTFHCYWSGILNIKHYYSILSCYYFNVHNNKHRIILWVENNRPNSFLEKLSKFVEIRQFSLNAEITDTFLENKTLKYNKTLSYYSDVVRYVLLYKYGGCWFDLDCLITRSFDPLFSAHGNEICVYNWENQPYPNGAIYISLEPRSERMKRNIEFIIERGRGWGFQEAQLTFDTTLDMLVLPCSWFDPSWISNPLNIGFDSFFKETEKGYTFEKFFPGIFCYHWHNQWNVMPHKSSPFMQLANILNEKLSL